MFAAGFAASNHALSLLKSCCIDENDVLLFGCGIEEVARHSYKLNVTVRFCPHFTTQHIRSIHMVFGWPYFEVQCRIASTNPVRTHVADGLVWNRRYLCDTNAADFGDVLMGVFAFTQTCVAANDCFYVRQPSPLIAYPAAPAFRILCKFAHPPVP